MPRIHLARGRILKYFQSNLQNKHSSPRAYTHKDTRTHAHTHQALICFSLTQRSRAAERRFVLRSFNPRYQPGGRPIYTPVGSRYKWSDRFGRSARVFHLKLHTSRLSESGRAHTHTSRRTGEFPDSKNTLSPELRQFGCQVCALITTVSPVGLPLNSNFAFDVHCPVLIKSNLAFRAPLGVGALR